MKTPSYLQLLTDYRSEIRPIDNSYYLICIKIEIESLN